MSRMRGRRSVKAALVLVLSLVGTGGLAACGGDEGADGSSGSGNDDIQVGEEFTYDGFTVAEGWKLDKVERDVAMEAVQMAEVSGEVTNEGDETRAPIFELVFALEGKEVTSLTCSARRLAPDETTDLLCPGLRSVYPEDFDTIVPQPFTR
jgi:hypothetical protein